MVRFSLELKLEKFGEIKFNLLTLLILGFFLFSCLKTAVNFLVRDDLNLEVIVYRSGAFEIWFFVVAAVGCSLYLFWRFLLWYREKKDLVIPSE